MMNKNINRSDQHWARGLWLSAFHSSFRIPHSSFLT